MQKADFFTEGIIAFYELVDQLIRYRVVLTLVFCRHDAYAITKRRRIPSGGEGRRWLNVEAVQVALVLLQMADFYIAIVQTLQR